MDKVIQSNTTKSVVMSIRVEADLYAHLKKVSEREDIPVSLLIRRAIKKGLNLPVLAKEAERVSMPDWE